MERNFLDRMNRIYGMGGWHPATRFALWRGHQPFNPRTQKILFILFILSEVQA